MRKYLLFLVLVFISVDSINSTRSILFRKFNVEIVNQLQFHKKLKVHCRCKNYYFPITYLNIGESFKFKFIIYPKTLYWCNLWQGPNYKHHVVFDAFRANCYFIDHTCSGIDPNVCRWTAKEQGVYVHDTLGEFFMYGWKPKNQREITPVNAPTTEFDPYI
ncbi:PREDICTED: uncharacterized protein LOC109128144 [Camelina sativa]|uniref:S-protein homolog n=1 Tax=Camelina sativa TaxID=90675 RepID=A0ABM1QRV5_CAMSA|nr:PREDICTED: uncharacterized protein LOC109128144 [Camelina sativa]